jgi:hypothetical protein
VAVLNEGSDEVEGEIRALEAKVSGRLAAGSGLWAGFAARKEVPANGFAAPDVEKGFDDIPEPEDAENGFADVGGPLGEPPKSCAPTLGCGCSTEASFDSTTFGF